MPSRVIELVVNGRHRELLVRPGMSLLGALRDGLGLTGAKRGCADGSCGACTVMLDGKPVLSCLVAVETVDGAAVRTVEGMAPDGPLTELQQAFVDGFATQCGFCTPGILMAAEALLAENPEPTREEVVRAISGSVCRCTGYTAIVDAILAGAEARRGVTV
ncbi:MAG TPA: (2Fe-2S)-binding protein [Gaiellaceae bacterium]|nr:(2Fe-2S)-binding protein [Gaiellaceae bacterium]